MNHRITTKWPHKCPLPILLNVVGNHLHHTLPRKPSNTIKIILHVPDSPSCSICFLRSDPPTTPTVMRFFRSFMKASMWGVIRPLAGERVPSTSNRARIRLFAPLIFHNPRLGLRLGLELAVRVRFSAKV